MRTEAYVNDVVNPVVIGVSYVDTYWLEREAIALFASLDGDGAGHHGIPGAAHGAIVHDTTAGWTTYTQRGKWLKLITMAIIINFP